MIYLLIGLLGNMDSYILGYCFGISFYYISDQLTPNIHINLIYWRYGVDFQHDIKINQYPNGVCELNTVKFRYSHSLLGLISVCP